MPLGAMTDDELDVLEGRLRVSSYRFKNDAADAIEQLRGERDALREQLAGAFQEGFEAGMAIVEVEQ